MAWTPKPGVKNVEQSMRMSEQDSVRDKAKAGSKSPKAPKIAADAGVSKGDMAGHEHLMQSEHFSGPKAPQNPASRAYNESDGMPEATDKMSKRFIGG